MDTNNLEQAINRITQETITSIAKLFEQFGQSDKNDITQEFARKIVHSNLSMAQQLIDESRQKVNSTFGRSFVVKTGDNFISSLGRKMAETHAEGNESSIIYKVDKQGVSCEIEPLMTDDLLYSQTVDVTLRALIDDKPCCFVVNVSTFEGAYIPSMDSKIQVSKIITKESSVAHAEAILLEAFDVVSIVEDFFADYKSQNITYNDTSLTDKQGNPYKIREFGGVFQIVALNNDFITSHDGLPELANERYFESLSEAQTFLNESMSKDR